MIAAIVLLALAGMGTATLALLAYRRALHVEAKVQTMADVLGLQPCFRAALLQYLIGDQRRPAMPPVEPPAPKPTSARGLN